MIRSPHFYGYGLLLAVILVMACIWRYDQIAASQKTAILDGFVDHLVGELQKNGVQIERMAGGGFRRTFGVVPPEYRIKGAAQPSTEASPYYGIGRRIELPGSDSQPY
jgi:hypothetical protein